MTLGYVCARKLVGDDDVLNGPVDRVRDQVLAIDDVTWNALQRAGLVEELSLLAVGLIDRHEDGAIEPRALERMIGVIEERAAYVDDALADFLASLRELALDALDRSVPLVFKIE